MTVNTIASNCVSLKILLGGILIGSCVLLLFNGFFYITGISIMGNKSRLYESLQNAPLVTSENIDKKKIIVLGSSVTQVSFSPYEFDRSLGKNGIQSLSYNYGFGGLNPTIQEAYSRRLIEQYQSGNPESKIDLTLIEFNPFQTTIARMKLDKFVEDQNLAQLMTPADIWKLTLEDPERGLLYFNIKYLRQSNSAGVLTAAFGFFVNQVKGEKQTTEAEKYYAALNTLEDKYEVEREKEIPGNYNRGRWVPSLNGGRMNIHGLSLETFDLLKEVEEKKRDPIRMQDFRKGRIECCDIEQLRFNQDLVESFIILVNNFKAVSKNVQIILYPRQLGLIKYSEETQNRLNQTLEYIAEKTGVPVANFQLEPQIKDEHFVDASHLTISTGTVIFSEIMANYYTKLFTKNF